MDMKDHKNDDAPWMGKEFKLDWTIMGQDQFAQILNIEIEYQDARPAFDGLNLKNITEILF